MRRNLLSLFAVVLVFSCAAVRAQSSKELNVYFIDVEGGQSTLFVTPSGQSLLVDTGWAGARDADRIVAVAKQAGLTQLDYVVLTHYHGDHAGGKVVNKREMMDQMVKTDRQPGTGAFPDHFKLRAVYDKVALATDHTIIKGVDANGKIVVVREMDVLRMFVKENGKWRVAGAELVPMFAQ